jgi:pimeloyl-ACP methyl ester carboxylesterase
MDLFLLSLSSFVWISPVLDRLAAGGETSEILSRIAGYGQRVESLSVSSWRNKLNILTLGPTSPERVVLFAAGAGGDPERHRPLLEHLAAHGCQVIALHFERLIARNATTPELLARPRGLVDALDEGASADTGVVVVGHSIGGWAARC